MDFYTILDLAVLAGPLLLSFDRKVAFYKKWPSAFSAIGIVVLIFGIWDIWKTASGVWSFNPTFAGTWRFIGLPLGEWLFFVFIPYACIFILACVRAYIKDVELRIPSANWYVLAVIFIVLAAVFRDRTYTGIVFLSVAVMIVFGNLFVPENYKSRNFWIAMLLTYIPFLIANGILTGKPVVLYNDAENMGIRVGTIPLEDFFYSFSMLLLGFFAYDLSYRFLGKSSGKPSTRKA
jgi:lycopene cyclase domain-containing protein